MRKLYRSTRRCRVAAAIVLLLAATAVRGVGARSYRYRRGGVVRSTWRRYYSRPGAFSIVLPHAPEYRSEVVKTSAGTVASHLWVASKQPIAFAISFADYPSSIRDTSPDHLLNGARNDVVGTLHGNLLRHREYSYGIYPAEAFTMQMEKGTLTQQGRIYLVGRRLYKLSATAPTYLSASPDIDRVLSSFRLQGH